MNIIGRGAGARALRERLADVSGPDIVWGRNGVNGYEQLCAFRAAEIPCPEFTQSRIVVGQWFRDNPINNQSIWGRKYHHARGNDIVPYGHRHFWYRDFWVQVVPDVQFELRVHVWDGKAFRTGVKQQVGGPVNPRSRIANLPVRNDRNGWKLRYGQEALDVVPSNLRSEARAIARKAVAACSYLYGAVDVYITSNGLVGVFEVNSAPALGELTTEAYVAVISNWAANQPSI